VLGTALLIGCNPTPNSSATNPSAQAQPTLPSSEALETTPNPLTATATKPAWVFCNTEFHGCTFTGLRKVRYVLSGKATVKSFYGGLNNCNADNFGLSRGGDGAATCDYASSYQTKTIPNPMPGMGGLGANVTVPLGHPGFAGPRVEPTDDFGAPSDIGAFREPCDVSHFSFDDPLVALGKPGASHLHMFFGN